MPGVRLYAPNLRSIALRSSGYYFLTTDTPELMRWLAAQLLEQGVELRLMQSFTDARRSDDGWQWRYIRDRIGCGTVGR